MNSVTNSSLRKKGRAGRIVFRTLLCVLLIPLCLVLLIVISLQFQKTQNYLGKKASSYLSEKINAEVQLEKLHIDLNQLELNGVFIRDLNNDTLLFAERINVAFDFFKVFSKTLSITSVEAKGINANIYQRYPDTLFNYEFISNAFSGTGKETLQPEVPDTISQWKFDLKQVVFRHTRFSYNDDLNGNHFKVNIGALTTTITEFDLNRSRIEVSDFSFVNSTAELFMVKPLKPDTTSIETDAPDYNISVKLLALQNIAFLYKDDIVQSDLLASIGNLNVKNAQLQMAPKLLKASSLHFNNSALVYTQRETEAVPAAAENINSIEPLDTSAAWRVMVNSVELDKNKFIYNNNNAASVKEGIDFNHLEVKDIRVSAQGLNGGEDLVTVHVSEMGLFEKSGFQLNHFKSDVYYDLKTIRLSGFKINTPHSNISNYFEASYPSLNAAISSPEKIQMKTDLSSVIGLQDLRFFAPHLFNDSLLRRSATGNFKINTKASGSLNELTISSFEANAAGMHARFNGQLKNVLTPSLMYADIADVEVLCVKKELLEIISDKLIPPAVNLPDSTKLIANYKGFVKNFDSNINLNSTSGNLIANVKMNPAAGNIEQPYKISVETENLDVGYLMKQPQTLGKISLKTNISGSGFDTSTLDTKVDLTVMEADVNKYTYSNLVMNGHILKKSFTGKASMNDRNLSFEFDGAVNLDASKPDFQFNLDLKGADFKALNLTSQDMRLSTHVMMDMTAPRGENPVGVAKIYNTLLIKDEKRYKADSFLVTSSGANGVDQISLTSDILTASLGGKFLLPELAGKFTQHINSYFNISPSTNDSLYASQNYTFGVTLVNPAILTAGLIPGLEKLTPSAIEGSFNSTERKFSLRADVPRVMYKGTVVDSLRIRMSSDEDALKYSSNISQVADSTFKFENVFFGGEAKNNNASFQFTTSKDDSIKQLLIAGNFEKGSDDYFLRIEKNLIVNGEDWTMDSSNFMQFAKNIFYAKNVSLRKDNHMMSLNSPERSTASPVEIKFENFDITTVSRLIENKDSLIAGNINGFVVMEKQNGHAAFKSDLIVKDFVFQSAPIGTIKLKADNYIDTKKYEIDLNVEGFGNDVNMKGFYNTASETDNLDLMVDIKHLGLASIQPFTAGSITRMSGALTGKLAVRGIPSDPDMKGTLQLTEAAFNPKIIDSYLRVPAGNLEFASKKIKMNNIVFYDTLNNEASVNGYVDISNLKNVTFDLRVRTEDFLAMNTNKRSNPLYYGRLFLKSNIRLSGSADLPVIDATAKLNKGSFLTYVKPESAVAKDEGKGIVEFTDSLHKYNEIMVRQDSAVTSTLKGFELNATIDVDRSVDIKMIIDPLAGDSLFLKGGGKLDFGMDRSGKTSLTGRYFIDEGGYYLTISDFVKRDFKIQKGSSVTWSGDMLDAFVELTAVYRIKASPIDLVQAQMAGMSELEMNKYRNQLNFDVLLKMNGFISSPEISFDIDLAPEDRGAMSGAINARLAELKEDETQMNKQVFALLTLKRFIGENPLENGSEGGFSSASRSSASKVLTQQLNSLSDKYVNFVDLDLGVNSYEDYSSGQQQGRTQLQVGVSKQIFNDRVTVRVGGNVDLEGERAKQNNANDVAGNVSIDYKLTEDGRYKLKAFREHQYENPIEGELTKTGAGFIFTRDFNKFKNLFRKSRNRDAPVKRK